MHTVTSAGVLAGELPGMLEFSTGDWYIRRCAAEGVCRGEISNVTDPVMMLHAGSIIVAENLGFGRQRPKGSLLELVGVGWRGG